MVKSHSISSLKKANNHGVEFFHTSSMANVCVLHNVWHSGKVCLTNELKAERKGKRRELEHDAKGRWLYTANSVQWDPRTPPCGVWFNFFSKEDIFSSKLLKTLFSYYYSQLSHSSLPHNSKTMLQFFKGQPSWRAIFLFCLLWLCKMSTGKIKAKKIFCLYSFSKSVKLSSA